jgi:hypothetical protein
LTRASQAEIHPDKVCQRLLVCGAMALIAFGTAQRR